MENNNIINMNSTPATAGVISQPQIEKSNLDQIRIAPGSYFIGNFGGKDRYIRFDLNAFAEMETKFGSMEEAQERLKGGSMKDIRSVLWLGLIWNEVVLDELTGEPIRYTISEYQVGSWLTTLNLEDVMAKLQDAISGSLPDNPETQSAGEVINTSAAATQPAGEVISPN